MIFFISDIHAHYSELYRRIDQLGNLEPFISGDNQLILLGDYLDRGSKSKKVLELIFSIQQSIGSENIIVLKGNHESWYSILTMEKLSIPEICLCLPTTKKAETIMS